MELRPVKVKAPHGASRLVIAWSDGTETGYEHWVLRGFCPCAGCQGHGGSIRFLEGTEQLGRTALELRRIDRVGNYALGLEWGDGHSSGIYTFRYLRELARLDGKEPPEVADVVLGTVR